MNKKKKPAFLKEDYRLLKKRDLKPIDKQVLSWILGHIASGNKIKARNKYLAVTFGVSPSNISRTVTDLLERGFIRCSYDEGNTRQIHVDEDNKRNISDYIKKDNDDRINGVAPPTQIKESASRVPEELKPVIDNIPAISEKLTPCEFVLCEFDPARLILRYIELDSTYDKLVNNLKSSWKVNDEDYGIVDFLRLLLKYREESKDLPMINMINKIIDGISADNVKNLARKDKSVDGEP